MILFFISIFISSSFYYCISDIVIYLIYIALMRKRCQLTNVDVHVCRQFKYTELCAEHVLVQCTMSLVVDAMQCT